MNARARHQSPNTSSTRLESDVGPIGSRERPPAGSLFPAGRDPNNRDRLYGSASPSEPRFLEGDAERGKRIIERWERAAAEGSSAMSMTASVLLWSGDAGNGWILDDETGELVARIDPSWLLERSRRASQTAPPSPQRATPAEHDRKAVAESGFFQVSAPAGRTRTG